MVASAAGSGKASAWRRTEAFPLSAAVGV